jgi:hypothetical protein
VFLSTPSFYTLPPAAGDKNEDGPLDSATDCPQLAYLLTCPASLPTAVAPTPPMMTTTRPLALNYVITGEWKEEAGSRVKRRDQRQGIPSMRQRAATSTPAVTT